MGEQLERRRSYQQRPYHRYWPGFPGVGCERHSSHGHCVWSSSDGRTIPDRPVPVQERRAAFVGDRRSEYADLYTQRKGYDRTEGDEGMCEKGRDRTGTSGDGDRP